MIVINNQLSIVIPTYNRAEFLDYSLSVHIAIVRKYNIQIVIIDNASTDNTELVFKKWEKEYSNLIYYRHKKNIGGIKNFEFSLEFAQTKYIWLLGDTYQIQSSVLEYVLNIINDENNKFDCIVMNLMNKINISSKNYNEQNLFLNELGALITCVAVSIINKGMVKDEIFNRYQQLWFTHTATILESIANKEFLVHWVQSESIQLLEHPTLQKTNWSHTPKAFEIGCEDWTNFIMSLPPMYKLENKMKCIMDFGKVSGLFTFRNLILLRMNGLLNIKIFNKYKKFFPFTINYPLWLIFIISLTPKIIFKMIALFTILLLKKDKKTKIINLFKTKI